MEACSPQRAAFLDPRHGADHSELATPDRITVFAAAAADQQRPVPTAAATPPRPLPRALLLHQVLACLGVLHAAKVTAFSWITARADSSRWALNILYLAWAATTVARPRLYWRHRQAERSCPAWAHCPSGASLLGRWAQHALLRGRQRGLLNPSVQAPGLGAGRSRSPRAKAAPPARTCLGCRVAITQGFRLLMYLFPSFRNPGVSAPRGCQHSAAGTAGACPRAARRGRPGPAQRLQGMAAAGAYAGRACTGCMPPAAPQQHSAAPAHLPHACRQPRR